MLNYILSVDFATPGFWVSIAIILLIIEVLHPLGFFAPFSVAGFLMAIKTYFFKSEQIYSVLVDGAAFCVLGVILIIPLRSLIYRFFDKTPNINDL